MAMVAAAPSPEAVPAPPSVLEPPADMKTIIDKTANSAFIGTDLDVVLRGKGIDKLMCAGDRGWVRSV